MHEREPDVSYLSSLAPHLHQFVEEKRVLGYRYRSQAHWLVAFDRFLLEQGVTTPDLPKAVIGAWARKRPHESVSTQRNRIQIVRQLCLFLMRRGFSPYLPGSHLVPKGHSAFVPHIFTQKQMSLFLTAADQIRPSPHSPGREVMLPLIFRLLYGCGLRVSEARHLQIRDVDLARDLLTVRDGKFRKDRLVPVAPSLAARLKGYLATHACGRRPDDLLFPAPDGGPLAPQTIDGAFRQLLWACRISHGGRGRGPRLHDFRHTFAVHRLMHWYRDDVDLGVALPVLSTYLGHVSLCGTQRYLRLTAEMYPDLTRALHARFGDVIPRKERP
jgi:integrase/recombinase XerD